MAGKDDRSPLGAFGHLFFGAAFQVILVAIAQDVCTIGSGGSLSVGILFAAMGFGTGVGPMTVRAVTGGRPDRMHQAILMSYLLGAGAVPTE